MTKNQYLTNYGMTKNQKHKITMNPK